MRKFFFLPALFFTVFLQTSYTNVQAQCTTTISSFPYFENFELSNGGWTTGGTASDWTWGRPNKQVISSALSTKGWITGGLTAAAYNNNENSWLQSPCFNLSSLANPYIKFKVFWETEKKYDGASFQYSLNGGTTWITLGSYSDYTACPANNWFNTSGINALGVHGWSGNIQPTAACTGGAGGGSGAWVIAQHEMSALAGQTNVRFRFVFGAGSVCNGYDGFAIDDIQIMEAPSATADFSYTCTGSNTIAVTPSVAGCNPSYSWDFGDPASGASNISTAANPTHFYAGPGQYTITMTSTVPGFPPVIVSKQVNILQVDIAVTQTIKCYGDKTAALSATVSPAGSYQYSWNTSPVQTTSSVSGLGKGNYTVSVTGADACAASESVGLTEPLKLIAQINYGQPYCGKLNGYAKAGGTDGTPPYTYLWANGGYTVDSLGSVGPGTYSVEITDANGCKAVATSELKEINNLRINLGPDTFICPGQQLILFPGNYASYKWQDSSSLPKFTVTQTGKYSVRVTNDSGCVATDEIKVTVDCSDIYFPTGFTADGNGLNDNFGALGNLVAVKHYRLRVFNRWGMVVFETTNPFNRWDGRVNNMESTTSTFTWLAEYELPNRKGRQVRKGVITLIR